MIQYAAVSMLVRFSIFALIGAALITGSGCTQLKPYQRERLAHPTMLLIDRMSPAAAHTYAIQEGAAGGSSAVEGGCGCN